MIARSGAHRYCFKPSKESLEGKRGYLLLCSAELGVCRLAPHVSHVYMNLYTSHTIAAEAMAGSTAWGLPAYDSTYARGDESTPFARRLKAYLEEHGFDVWMDEEGIAGGVDFMSAIGK